VLHLDDLAELSYVEELRIGSIDDPVAGFSQIRSVQTSDKGEVFVLDGQAREVRVFNEMGERVRAFGREGQGPGEFTRPVGMGLIGDTVWVTDIQNRRISWFSSEGNVLFSMPIQGVPFDVGIQGVSLTLTPGKPRPDGLIESDRNLVMRLNREYRPYRFPILLFDRSGEVVDTLRWEMADENVAVFQVGGQRGYAPSLMPTRPVRGDFPVGRVIVDWSVPEGGGEGTVEIVRHGLGSDTVYHERLGFTPILVSDHVLDSLITPLVASAAIFNVSEAELEGALRDAVEIPEYRAPIRSVYAGSDGTLWMQLNTSSLEISDWVVITRDGEILGRVGLPPKMRINLSAFPTFWAVETDEFDVPWLVRLRVQ
jgi:hypothetical protein